MSTCQNDQGECLHPTLETDAIRLRQEGLLCGEANLQWAEKLERERDEAREQLACEKSTRNAIIAKGIETERQLAEAREENARLREALADCASHLEGWHTMEALENARKLLTP